MGSLGRRLYPACGQNSRPYATAQQLVETPYDPSSRASGVEALVPLLSLRFEAAALALNLPPRCSPLTQLGVLQRVSFTHPVPGECLLWGGARPTP
jgi:hypothetical protein